MKKGYLKRLLAILLVFTMIAPVNYVNAASKQVTLSGNSFYFDWEGVDTYKLTIKCDYAVKLTFNTGSLTRFKVSKTSLSAGTNTITLSVKSGYKNPSSGAFSDALIITPYSGSSTYKDFAVSASLKQVGNPYKNVLSKNKEGSVAGVSARYGVYSFEYKMNLFAYYYKSGSNNVFGKYAATTMLKSYNSSLSYSFYKPAAVSIMSGSTQKYKKVLGADYPGGGNYFPSGWKTSSGYNYSETILSASTSYKASATMMINPDGGIPHTITVELPLKAN